jgi:hypothetical protein
MRQPFLMLKAWLLCETASFSIEPTTNAALPAKWRGAQKAHATAAAG